MALKNQKLKTTRTLRLTPEGWVFLVILVFVAFGSILRNVNLLIVLSGMMFAAIMLNWRSALLRLRSLDAHRTLPDRIFADRLTNVVWHFTNHHPTHTAFSVNVDDRIDETKIDDEASGEKIVSFLRRVRQNISDSINRLRRVGPNHVRVNLRMLPANSTQSLVYQAWFQNRGEYQTGPSAITSTFPFGLIELKVSSQQHQTIYVAPPLGELHPRWDQRANALLIGSDSSKRKRGTADDQFFALRKWRSGDGKKQIHWRSTARTGVPMVKQFDQPSDKDVAIVIDLFQDESVSDADIETLLSFAVTAAVRLGTGQHGRLSIALCGRHCETFQHLATPEANSSFLKATSIAASDPDPDVFSGVRDAGKSVASGTPVVVVSTRREPVWIKQFTEADSVAAHNQKNDIFRSLAYPDAALGGLTDMIHWVEVGSESFRAMFSASEQHDQSSLEKFSQRWGA